MTNIYIYIYIQDKTTTITLLDPLDDEVSGAIRIASHAPIRAVRANSINGIVNFGIGWAAVAPAVDNCGSNVKVIWVETRLVVASMRDDVHWLRQLQKDTRTNH